MKKKTPIIHKLGYRLSKRLC